LVLPGALVSRLQISIVEEFAARTIDVLKVAVDDPDLLGKTGRRHSQGSRNQNSSQHVRELLFLSSTRHQYKNPLRWLLFRRRCGRCSLALLPQIGGVLLMIGRGAR
jgi:hypothetical protein